VESAARVGRNDDTAIDRARSASSMPRALSATWTPEAQTMPPSRPLRYVVPEYHSTLKVPQSYLTDPDRESACSWPGGTYATFLFSYCYDAFYCFAGIPMHFSSSGDLLAHDGRLKTSAPRPTNLSKSGTEMHPDRGWCPRSTHSTGVRRRVGQGRFRMRRAAFLVDRVPPAESRRTQDMADNHVATMTDICRFALTCSCPFGPTGCARAWCFATVLRPHDVEQKRAEVRTRSDADDR